MRAPAASVLSLGWMITAWASSATAQSVPMERFEEAPATPPPPAAGAQAKPRVAPRVVLPEPISAEVTYPSGASGAHRVALQLTLRADGTVERAVAVEGSPPFSSHAEKEALLWRFRPAMRDGSPVAATIRFLVEFEPQTGPMAEPEPEPRAPAAKAATEQPAGTAPDQPPLEVVVHGQRAPATRRLGRAEIRELPGAFGDPFRAVEALPGVVPIVSGVPYFYVRGAPPGNVGYYFDGVPVPMLYHFAAGPGVLHPAFVEQVDLYPAVYPVRYGRFAGGIVAGEMGPPSYAWRGEASLRLVDSGGMLEAPFSDARASAMLGGRYSYTALVLSLIVPEITLQYWDYQSRVRYPLGHDDSLELVVFGSGDVLAVEQQEHAYGASEPELVTHSVVDVNFHRLDLRYDRKLRSGRWRNAVLLGLDNTAADEGNVRFVNRMIGARSELEQLLDPGVTLRSGADVLFEGLAQRLEEGEDRDEVSMPPPSDLPPGTPTAQPAPPIEPDEESDEAPDFGFDEARSDLVIGAYTDLVLDAGSGVELIPGLRADLFISGRDVALGVDPRIAARFAITDTLTATHGLGLAHQLPSFVVPIPGVKPSLQGGLQRALQHSAGLDAKLPWGCSGSFVLFHNLFFNLTDYIGLVQLSRTEDTERTPENLRMDGRGYGVELMVRRSLTKSLGGFVSYTLSRSERYRGRLEGPATIDRTHVLNIALSYNLGRHWRLGNRLLLYSGIPARVAYLAAARRPPRTPPFWRVDWRLQKRWPSADGHGYWGFVAEVLNTFLAEEVLERSCSAHICADSEIGPVTVPSLGVEAAF